MSYLVTIVITCDARECLRTLVLHRGNRGGLSSTHAANVAAESGWLVRAGMSSTANAKVSYCPQHLKPESR